MNTIQNLHERALAAAKSFKQAESDLVDIFQELDEAKAFIKLGYASLFEYGVKALGLSEANTYAFIQVARAAREVPALKSAIQNGLLTVSKAKRIAPVITRENQDNWLAKAQTLSKSGLEKEVARTNPALAVRETSRYVTAERLELKLGISENLLEKLKRVQDLESQRTSSAVSLEKALEQMTEEYLEKHDPVRKVVRAKSQLLVVNSKVNAENVNPNMRMKPNTPVKPKTPTSNPELGPGRVRERIPNATRHALNARDQGQCTHVSEKGDRCDQRRWTHIHHKKAVMDGGGNNLSNLTTLCSQHHRFMHIKEKHD